MITTQDVLLTPARAGDVQRYHVWPTLRRQTVAEHTWGVMRIWWEVFGPLPSHVSTVLMWHDCGEIGSGDVPHYAKRDSPELKAAVGAVETRTFLAMMLELNGEHEWVLARNQMSPGELRRFKACDLLEMGEFAAHEQALGSRYADAIVENVTIGLRVLYPDNSTDDGAATWAYYLRRVDASRSQPWLVATRERAA